MADQFESPVDIEGAVSSGSGLAYMGVAVGLALYVVVVFNAHALAAWADGLAPGARTARIGAVAHGLAQRTAASGLDTPRAAIKSGWDAAKAARWPGQIDAQR